MRALLVTAALLLSGCYLRHWRHSDFCDLCLSNRRAPACQAACDTRDMSLRERRTEAQAKLFDAWVDARNEYRRCRMEKGDGGQRGIFPCWRELNARDAAAKRYWKMK